MKHSMACILVAAVSVAFVGGATGNPGREPGPATVAVVHAADILAERPFLVPASVYPLGRQDYAVVVRMLDRAVMLATGIYKVDEAWSAVVARGDRVGILFDAQSPPASLALVDAMIDRLVRIGVRPADITVWARNEQALFSAGLVVRKGPEGVNTMGADSEGFIGGLSRIVLGYCDVVINLARLRADGRVGVWGAVANQLACVPEEDRIRLLGNQTELAAAAARPSTRAKFRLHILDALQPNYEPGAIRMPPYWTAGKLLASTDCVALDTVGRQLLEAKRQQVRGQAWPLDPAPDYLTVATTLHRLGQSDPAAITVVPHEIGAGG